MSTKYRSVTIHNGKHVWQLTVLGKPLRSKQHFDEALDAALDVDLVKHHLRVDFYINLPASLDGEMFSSLAYSRRGVILSDSRSVFAALPECAQQFVSDHKEMLTAHADANRPQLRDWEKLRNHTNPAIRDWVLACERAEHRVEEFKKINHEYLDACLASVSARLAHVVSPLGRAITMHGRSEYPALHARLEQMHELRRQIEALAIVSDEMRVEFLTDNRETHSALGKLEANRPLLA